jgi:hypothetical protein
MLFWVEAQRRLVPTVTIAQSLASYFEFIHEDDFDITCAQVTMSRLKAEFIDLQYEKDK